MIWLSWRQFRAQVITAAAALAVFAIVLAATASHLSSTYDSSGLATCHGATCAGWPGCSGSGTPRQDRHRRPIGCVVVGHYESFFITSAGASAAILGC
jgi:hypothetical protein